jgi:predicted RNA polymerase sigma factor
MRAGRMGRLLMPDESEVHGLLAMMLLHDVRRGASCCGASVEPT